MSLIERILKGESIKDVFEKPHSHYVREDLPKANVVVPINKILDSFGYVAVLGSIATRLEGEVDEMAAISSSFTEVDRQQYKAKEKVRQLVSQAQAAAELGGI